VSSRSLQGLSWFRPWRMDLMPDAKSGFRSVPVFDLNRRFFREPTDLVSTPPGHDVADELSGVIDFYWKRGNAVPSTIKTEYVSHAGCRN
jgi:hypothetical protein